MASPPSVKQQQPGAAVKRASDSPLDFYLTAVEMSEPGKNVFMSTLSAALATAMLHAGATGKTAEEMKRVLHLPREKTILENGLRALHEALANTPNVTLEMANRIYVEQSRRLKSEFIKKLSEIHKSDIQQADFVSNSEAERGKINGWVSEKTHDKINDFLPPDTLDESTRLVLVNAVYFYGKWKTQFNAATRDLDFHVTPDNTVKVPALRVTAHLNFADIPELKARAVEVPYHNESVRMQIILPHERDGLDGVHKKLRNNAFDLSKMSFCKIEVHLVIPRFSIEDTVDLQDVFQEMGITTMFTDGAEFGGMVDGDEPLPVSRAIQKSGMVVSDAGAEPAGPTVRGLMLHSAPYPGVVVLIVNHPFLFRVMRGDVELFMGCVWRL